MPSYVECIKIAYELIVIVEADTEHRKGNFILNG